MAEPSMSGAPGRAAPAAKWSVAAILAAAAAGLLWFAASTGATASDESRASAAQANGVLLVAGQVAADSYGFYLVDTTTSTICVYQWMPATKKLRLLASRYYGYDLRLEDYNNERETAPDEIRRLIESQRRLGVTTTRPAAADGNMR
jgi:hypothetical protein